MVRAILLGHVQGHVSHVVHRVRTVSPTEHDGHVADDVVDDQRGHVLRHVPRTRYESHPELGFIQEAVQRKGNLRFNPTILTSDHPDPVLSERRQKFTIQTKI